MDDTAVLREHGINTSAQRVAVASYVLFIEDGTGEIQDVPWDAIKVSSVARLKGLDVREYQVVMRGTKSPKRSR